ncbi:MAG: hypothetical protein V3W18_00995 [candidate division Zixibacteria bacterium]
MVSVNFKSSNWKHLVWILYACAFLFGLPFLFITLLDLPIDVYHLIFLLSSAAFVVTYRKYSSFKVRSSLKTGWALGLILAFFAGMGFISLSLSESLQFSEFVSRLGEPLVLWRGIAFGLASGVMISTLPFVVVWRSLAGHNPGGLRKIGVVLVAVVSIAILTFSHNLGLTGLDNMSGRIQRNIAVGLPTLLSGNPMAAAIAGAFLYVSEEAKSDNAQISKPVIKTVIADNPEQNGGAN